MYKSQYLRRKFFLFFIMTRRNKNKFSSVIAIFKQYLGFYFYDIPNLYTHYYLFNFLK
jgi:hypothetical protein